MSNVMKRNQCAVRTPQFLHPLTLENLCSPQHPKHIAKGVFLTLTSSKDAQKWENTNCSILQTDVRTPAMSVTDIATTLLHEDPHRTRFSLLEPPSRICASPYQEQRVLPTPSLSYNHHQALDSSPRLSIDTSSSSKKALLPSYPDIISRQSGIALCFRPAMRNSGLGIWWSPSELFIVIKR
jgi:hypothetical protein